VSPDLARLVYDIARQEGIDPELAFRLVQVESRFNPRVASPAGAVGLTQLMPATARYLQPGVTREQLLDPATNLRIGFRYLRTLIREQRGDLKLALLVYNRGPVAVAQDLARGVDPTNGYERVVMRGLRGRGVLD
jgi:soluble lytic murein transglycosylase-like protein